MIASIKYNRGSVLMEYVILTCAISFVLLGFVNFAFDPAGRMFDNEGAIDEQSFGFFGDAWVELIRSIMHGIGSPTPFAALEATNGQPPLPHDTADIDHALVRHQLSVEDPSSFFPAPSAWGFGTTSIHPETADKRCGLTRGTPGRSLG